MTNPAPTTHGRATSSPREPGRGRPGDTLLPPVAGAIICPYCEGAGCLVCNHGGLDTIQNT